MAFIHFLYKFFLLMSVHDRLHGYSPPPQLTMQHHMIGTEADCALLLQRMYVDTRAYRYSNNHLRSKRSPYNMFPLNSSPNPNYSFDDFLQLFQPKSPAYSGAIKELCIRFADVNKAVSMAKAKRHFVAPKDIYSLEPHPASIAVVGELNQAVTQILAHEFELSPDEILNGLPLIDMSRTTFWDVCPDHVKPIPCTIDRFRTFTGHCNNLKHPAWGASNMPFVRYLPPVHPDGIFAERISVVGGAPLPTPRKVTALVHRDHDMPHTDATILVMSWGQLIDHDLALAAPPRGQYYPVSNQSVRLLT